MTSAAPSARVLLPCGRAFSIDQGDLALLDGRNWYSDVRHHTVYVRGRQPGGTRHVYLHTLLMGGRTDHIDGDGLNNRRVNLRRCSQRQNNLNRGPKHGKRFKGVYARGRKFYAQIYKDGVAHTQHGFFTEEEAARAYDAMAVNLHGQWARLNFSKSETALRFLDRADGRQGDLFAEGGAP